MRPDFNKITEEARKSMQERHASLENQFDEVQKAFVQILARDCKVPESTARDILDAIVREPRLHSMMDHYLEVSDYIFHERMKQDLRSSLLQALLGKEAS